MQATAVQKQLRRVLVRVLLVVGLIQFTSAGFQSSLAANADIAGSTNSAWTRVAQASQAVRWLAASPVNADIVYAAVDDPINGGVYRSQDAGHSWESSPLFANNGLSNLQVQAVAVCPSGQVFAGTWGGGVYRGGAASWTQVSNGISEWYVTALTCDSAGRLFAGSARSGVFRSANAGDSWTAVNSGLANQSILSIQSSGTKVFAGTADGAFSSMNAGDSWNRAGLQGQQVYDFEFDPTNGQKVWAATTGAGVVASTDGGASWNPVGAPLQAYSVGRDGDGKLYAGTRADGAYRLIDGQWIAQDMAARKVYCLHAFGRSASRIVAGTIDGIWTPPMPRVQVKLRNNPESTVPNGGQITYLVDYWGEGVGVVSNVNVTAPIPPGTVLIAGSMTPPGTSSMADRTVSWHFDRLDPDTDHGVLSYSVRTCVAVRTQVNPPGAGSISLPPSNCPGSTRYAPGVPLGISSSASTGYTFAAWTATSGSLGNAGIAQTTFAPGNADTTLTARFQANPVTLTISPTTGGTVTATPPGPYHYGDVVTLQAAADTGYTFAGWTGDLSGTTNPTKITLNGNKTVGAAFQANPVTLTLSSATGGTIKATPAGPYHYGDVVTLQAVADPGYTFTGWTGDLTGTTNPATVTLNGDKTVGATYELNAVSLTISPTSGGSINATPAGPYHYGDVVTLQATANTGYSFTGWSGDLSGTANPATITLNGNKKVGAAFQANPVMLTLNPATGGSIAATPPGPYHYGDVVTLQANPNAGYTFTGWTGDLAGTTNPATITLNGNKTVGATFSRNAVTLTLSPTSGGTIKVTPAGPYHYGDVVTLQATSNTGYTFTGWTGDLTGTTNPTTITLNGNKTVGATFGLNAVTLTISPTSGGTIKASPAGPYHYGDVVSLQATPNTGYSFTGWTGDLTGTTNPTTITLNGNKTVGGTFQANPVTLTLNAGAGGSIAATPPGPYHYGDVVSLTATPNTGYSFTGWTGDLSGTTNPATITLNGNKTVGATFQGNPVTLTLSPGAGGSITASPPGPYRYGDVVSLTASSNTGYGFAGWTGDLSGTTNPANITLNGNKTVGATFEANLVTLTIIQSTGGTISQTPAGPYHYGDVVTVRATPNTGYSFTGWTGDLTGTTNPTTITLNGNKTFSATFQANPVTLTLNQSTGGTISATPAGPYRYGDVVSLTATPNTGYSFTGWTGDLTGTANPTTITLNGNKTVGGTFQANPVTLTLNAGTGGSIAATPSGPYHYGDVVTLQANPNTGYSFTGWTGDLTGTTNPAKLTLNGDKTVAAAFQANPVTLTLNQSTGGTITAAPPGPYRYWDVVSLTATANTGYTFTGWTGDLGGTTNPASITLSGNKTVVATFQANPVTLTLNVGAGGTVIATPPGPYYYGQVVSLQATPNTGYSFTGWTGDLTGTTNPTTITLNGNKTVSAAFQANPVTLTITQSTGGTIAATPAGPYYYGQVVSLQATPGTGYSFTGWTGDLTGTTNPTTITLNGNKTVGGTFTLNVVALTISPATGGSITATPPGPYHYGDVVTVQATPNTGYSFTGWTGDLTGTTNPTTITLNGNKTVGATFTLNVVTLTINAPIGGAITANPPGPYHYGDVVSVQATANTGYTFTGWTGDLAGTTNPTTITLNGNKTVGATFQANPVTLTINQSTGGTIAATPAGPYYYGQVVSLQATPNTGYSFTGWTGDLTGTANPATITLNGDKTVSAAFQANPVTLTINPGTGGTITANPPGPYRYGDVVSLTATANTGYSFTGWSGDLSGTTNPESLTLNGNKTVGAAFQANPVTLAIDQPTGGTVSATPAGPYHYGDVVSLRATPNTGYGFTGWTGDLSGTTNPASLTLNGDKTVGATFELSVVTLTIKQATGGTIAATPAGPYHYGDVVAVQATPSTGYSFTGWTGDLNGTTNPTTITLNGNKTVGATFLGDPVTLTLSPATGGTVTASPPGPYRYGDVVTLQATGDTGYGFAGWTGDLSGTANPATITLNGDKTVGATFELSLVTLTINQSTGGTITVNPAGPYHYGDVVTVQATAATGYSFTDWTGALSGTTNPTTITLNGDKTIGATYERNPVTLTLSPTTNGTITATPPGPYRYGDVVTVQASASTNYTFAGWTGDLAGTTNPTTITLNGDKTVGATFQGVPVTLTLNPGAGGTISANPPGPYHYNDVVTLQAVPNAGYSFTGWTGDLTGTTNPTTITLNGNKSIGATFKLNTVTLTITPTTSGSIKATPGGAHHYGDVVTLQAIADAGYTFTGWTGDLSGTTNPTTLTMNGDKTVGATFAAATVEAGAPLQTARDEAIVTQEGLLGEMALASAYPVINTGATVTWEYGGTQYKATSNSTVNAVSLFLPLIFR